MEYSELNHCAPSRQHRAWSLSATLLGLGLVLLTGCASLSSTPPPEPPAIADNQARMDWHLRFLSGWQDGQGAVRLRPAVTDDVVYAAHSDGQIAALHKDTGRVIWRTQYEPWQAGVTYSAGKLYLINQDGALNVLSAETGELEQTNQLGLSTLTPPTVSGQYIAILGQDGALRLWDNSSQTWVWIYDSEQPTLTLHGQARPIIVDDTVIAGFANGRLVGFNLRTGELRWAQRLSDPRGSTDLQRLVDADPGPLLVNGRIYAGAFEGRLVEVMPDSGELRWETRQSVTANLATDGRSLFVANRAGEVIAYDLSNKGIRWQQQGYTGRPITGLSVTGEGLVVTDRRGYAHVLSTRTGDSLGRIDFGGHQHFTVPAATDTERFYLQSMEGLILGNSLRLPQE